MSTFEIDPEAGHQPSVQSPLTEQMQLCSLPRHGKRRGLG